MQYQIDCTAYDFLMIHCVRCNSIQQKTQNALCKQNIIQGYFIKEMVSSAFFIIYKSQIQDNQKTSQLKFSVF